MTRLMGDATGAQAATLAAVPGLQLVAGYVTGSPDIVWGSVDWLMFRQPKVTIDQGFTGSPVPGAIVRDVETGAWTPGGAVLNGPWNPPRPTIYCNRSTLPAVLAAGWHGDLWLAIPGWFQGDPLPSAPGCTIVAVQNNFDNPAYDLSVVLDPTWPFGGPMPVTIAGVPGTWAAYPQSFTSAAGVPYLVGYGWDGSQSDGHVWMTKFVGGAWTGLVRL